MQHGSRRPIVVDPSHRATGSHSVSTRRRTAALAAVVTAIGLVSGWLVAATPAGAGPSAVDIKSVSWKVAGQGSTMAVKPRYSARKGIAVRTATLSVRRASTWVAKGVKSAKLSPGSYRVTTKVTYRVRTQSGLGRVRTSTRTQSLRVPSPAPPQSPVAVPAAAAQTPAPAPAPVAPATTSLGSTGRACDSSSLRKADGSAWVCSFVDEFDGSLLDTVKWNPQATATSGYKLGGDCFVNRPENISVGGGALSLTVRKEASPFMCQSPGGSYTTQHTSGMVTTLSSFAQTFGRFEIRAAFPKTVVPGHHSALWLYPKTPKAAFPYSGEIDIAEMYSQWPDRVIPFIHYGLSGWDPTVTNNYCMVEDVSQFHTYTLEWTPTTLSIAYDGAVCVTHTINGLMPSLGSAPFDSDFMVVLTQGLGLGGNAVTAATPASGTTKVDYVRVWK